MICLIWLLRTRTGFTPQPAGPAAHTRDLPFIGKNRLAEQLGYLRAAITYSRRHAAGVTRVQAARAALVDVAQPHEVIDDQLAPGLEQAASRPVPSGPVKT